jgi:hypothetical protein
MAHTPEHGEHGHPTTCSSARTFHCSDMGKMLHFRYVHQTGQGREATLGRQGPRHRVFGPAEAGPPLPPTAQIDTVRSASCQDRQVRYLGGARTHLMCVTHCSEDEADRAAWLRWPKSMAAEEADAEDWLMRDAW